MVIMEGRKTLCLPPEPTDDVGGPHPSFFPQILPLCLLLEEPLLSLLPPNEGLFPVDEDPPPEEPQVASVDPHPSPPEVWLLEEAVVVAVIVVDPPQSSPHPSSAIGYKIFGN